MEKTYGTGMYQLFVSLIALPNFFARRSATRRQCSKTSAAKNLNIEQIQIKRNLLLTSMHC